MWDFFVGFGKMMWFLFLVILLFNFLILVHELGHYWAAKWRGLKVEKFQIWFGKPIWKKTVNGVQWGLGSIPLGGFVALPQMAPMDAIEQGSGDREKLPPITPLDKIIVAFAGPLFSLLLGFAFAVLVWQVGKPSHVSSTTQIVGYVNPKAPAAEVLQPGDKVLEVDGVEVRGFGGMVDSISERVVFSKGDSVTMKIARPGIAEPFEVEMAVELTESGLLKRPGHRQVGVGPLTPLTVAGVSEGGPAEAAGFEKGDEIISADGERLYSRMRLSQIIAEGKGRTIAIEVDRGGETVALQLTPKQPKSGPSYSKAEQDAGMGVEGEKMYLAGIIWDPSAGRSLVHPGPSPFGQVADAGTAMFRTFAALFSTNDNINAGHMSGPIGIGGMYYDVLSGPDGWRMALVISVLINVNLGLLNLLPFPVLDGGHITMAIYEWIRKKALNVRVLEYVQVACVLLLLGFIIYVSVFDITDRTSRGGRETPELVW